MGASATPSGSRPSDGAQEVSTLSGFDPSRVETIGRATPPELNNHSEARATPEQSPPGRYLLRNDGFFDKPYEAELLEWSAGGRLKLGAPGSPRWLEGRDIPFVVERLASADTRPQGGDATEIAAPFTSGAVGSEADETPKPSQGAEQQQCRSGR